MLPSPEQRIISEVPQINQVNGFVGEAHPLLRRKLVAREGLDNLGEFYRNRDMRIAFTTGAYDMIHIGHGRYLELARSLGDILVVGLNSDQSIKGYKGPDRPILEELKRAEMLAYLSCVDFITIYDELRGDEVIRRLRPDAYLCVEGSWEGDYEDLKKKEEVVAMTDHGGQTFVSPRQDPWLSTSAIIEKLMGDGSRVMLDQLKSLVNTLEQKVPEAKSL